VYPSKMPSKEQDSNLSRFPRFRTKHLHPKCEVRQKACDQSEVQRGSNAEMSARRFD
jgi:hypothetical protein